MDNDTTKREADTEYQRQYYLKNRERKLEYQREHRQKHKSELAAKQKAYREAHKNAIAEYQRQYRRDNIEAVAERDRRYAELNRESKTKYHQMYQRLNKQRLAIKKRQYYLANREKIIRKTSTYQRLNPHISLAARQRRAARKHALPDTFTAQHWSLCLDYWHNTCAVCGGQLRGLFDIEPHADHWIPLDYKGSDNPGTVPGNMICLCNSCNCSKKNSSPAAWLETRFGRIRAKEILRRITAYFKWIQDK